MSIHTVFIKQSFGQQVTTDKMVVIAGNYEVASDILIKSKVFDIEDQDHLESLIETLDFVCYTSDLELLLTI